MNKTLLMVLLVVLGTGGCATNPVTGEKELSLVSESWELSVGAEQYAPMRQSEGGDYVVDPRVEAYVATVGQRLAAVSDRKLPYEFSVLNNSVPNAWALPGGKIAVNRGLLTELNSEAELAAVLGHEIVHAAARHGAQGMQRGMLLQGAIMATTIATQNERYANLAQIGASIGAQLVSQKYGRDAERESDHYGMLYMSRAGYDPQGAVELQETFVKLSEGRNPDWLSGMFSSHPPSQERVQNNIRDAERLPKGGEVAQGRYRQKIARLIKTKRAYESYEKAQKAFADGKTRQARALLQQALKIESREGHFYSLLGDIERKERNFSAAKGRYDQAIGLNDDFFYYHLQRGLLNEQMHANTAAQRDLQRSVSLLPTADAYNALGNIAKSQRQYDKAKQYYAQAAGHDSAAGKAAFGGLVDLDLADNPGKYIQVRTRVDRSGKVMVEVGNPTPRNVTGLVLALRYPDSSGALRDLRQALPGSLTAGQKKVLKLNVVVSPGQAGKIRSAIVAARVAQ